METGAQRCVLFGAFALCPLFFPCFASAQSLYKCAGQDGRVVYQQTPCAGTGSKMNVTVPSGFEGGAPPGKSGIATPSPAAPTKDRSENGSAGVSLPESPPTQARGRLDGWPKSGDRLIEGMSPKEVIEQWGRPHRIDVVEGRGLFLDYCDSRAAFFFDGKLASWSALFPESKAGARTYKYGEPWTAASMRWGYKRDRSTFSNSVSDRGDVQTWGRGKWIVTDTHGNIVSWCDTNGSSMSPPTRMTAWE